MDATTSSIRRSGIFNSHAAEVAREVFPVPDKPEKMTRIVFILLCVMAG
jgi:hypothetical protein